MILISRRLYANQKPSVVKRGMKHVLELILLQNRSFHSRASRVYNPQEWYRSKKLTRVYSGLSILFDARIHLTVHIVVRRVNEKRNEEKSCQTDRGNVKLKTAPLVSTLFLPDIVPPWASTILFEM